MEFLIVFLGVIGSVLFILTYNAFVWGFVTHTIYNWFILTVFPDAPELSVFQFVGIAMFIRALHPLTSLVSIKEEYKDEKAQWLNVFLTPWLVLIFAWFIHLFN
jgi:hypothetical protein